MGKWAKEFDAGSKAYYYYNIETYETTWDRPADFEEEGLADNLSVSEGLIMLKAVKRIQRGYRAKLARGAMRVKRAEKHASENKMGSCKWVATWDPQSKANYYYHIDTHEVRRRWKKMSNDEFDQSLYFIPACLTLSTVFLYFFLQIHFFFVFSK